MPRKPRKICSRAGESNRRSASRTRAQEPDVPEREYEPKPPERAALQRYYDRQKEAPRAPRLKISEKDGVPSTAIDHPDSTVGWVLLMQALGTSDPDFLDGLIRQVVNAGSQGQKPDQAAVNFMLAAIKGMEPRDQVESMLAAQMTAVHMATMTFARRLAHVENIPQQDSAERAFNKLCRTFAVQVEALKRYRTGGQQKVTVEHVTVNEGGQAVVGSVTTGGRGS